MWGFWRKFKIAIAEKEKRLAKLSKKEVMLLHHHQYTTPRTK
jgi:hypothetical protein